MQPTRSTRKIEIILNDNFIINVDLDIKVKITKSVLTLPNSAICTVYNLAEKTLQKLDEVPKVKILLDGNLLFTGKVINSINNYIGTSWECNIYCSDIETDPYIKPQYVEILSGTSNDQVLNQMGGIISKFGIDKTAFEDCAKAKGSLLKGMVVEYKKEGDVLRAMQNMFKECNTEVIKEDGVVKLLDKTKVLNAQKPITITLDKLLKSPTLSLKDITVDIPLNYKIKLGIGFEVKAKSINKKLESPFTYKNKFENKIFRIAEFTHEFDNFTREVAKTFIKGTPIA